MSRAHHVDRVEEGASAARQPPPQIEARYPHQHGEHATLRLHTRRVAIGAEQAPALERRERAAIAVLGDAVEDDVEPARQDAREVFALVVDRGGAQLADQHRMHAARSAPQLEAGQPAEGEQCLADGAGSPLHERALASLDPGRAVQELVGGRPAQDQRGGLSRIDPRRHAGKTVSPERAIGGVRPDHRHIGHAVAELKAAHAVTELIDFPDNVIAHHEGQPATHRLRIEVAPDQDVGVLQTRCEHADPHLTAAGRGQRSVDHLQPIGTAELPDLKNPIVRLFHARSPAHGRKKSRSSCDTLLNSLDQRSFRWRMRTSS